MPDPQKPISDKQLAANRSNAARSTGPRTGRPLGQGKARSARNAVKHGFTASHFSVIRLEDHDEVARLTEDLVSVYQPVNAQELLALQRMALAQQSIFRAARLESGLFTTCLNEALSPDDQPYFEVNAELSSDIEITRSQNRNFLLGEGFHRLTKLTNSWTLFLRYQAQAERLYRRALEDFERLRKLRPELPNEPILECPPDAGEANGPQEPAAVPPEPPSPAISSPSVPPATHPQPAIAPPPSEPLSVNPPETIAPLLPLPEESFDIRPHNV